MNSVCQTCGVSFDSLFPRKNCFTCIPAKGDTFPLPCPVCGQTFLSFGVKKYCSIECSYRRERPRHVTHLTCVTCGKAFTRRTQWVNNPDMSTCSRACWLAWLRTPEGHHATFRQERRPQANTTCWQCGKPLYRMPSHQGRAFCDRTCAGQYRSRLYTLKHRLPLTGLSEKQIHQLLEVHHIG